MKATLIIASLVAVAFSAPVAPHTNRDSAAPHTNRRQAGNLQTFTGALGGVAATPVLNSGDAKRPFSVKGDTFVNIAAALQRSCDQQFNACANKANGGDATLSVSACSAQKDQCGAASKQGAQANNQGSKQGAQANNNGSKQNGNANQGAASGCGQVNKA